MFNYINYNALVAGLTLIIFLNGMIAGATSAFAQAAAKVKAAVPVIYFNYDTRASNYCENISGEIEAGSQVKIVYSAARKSVLFKNNDTVYMRYSYDGWYTCQDLLLKANSKGELCGTLKISEGASRIDVAFFGSYAPPQYSKGDYQSWGFIWDSNYGKNFNFDIITKKELAERDKMAKLENNGKINL